MIFRWLLRRQRQRVWKSLVLPDAYKEQAEKDDWISPDLSEWQAFRTLFFPMSIVRGASPEVLSELTQMTRRVLVEAEKKEKDDKNTSA